ncbi:cholecystokinin receptor type A-like isoform X2 [Gordionus sp. m RMFG-2023]|uniref:cholecystokinin receptor type A-like isoform X2 n=1 Tax=Gordionus sp. m RMFG-2023 TaxID=3053472 RepID=UPI0031FD2A02
MFFSAEQIVIIAVSSAIFSLSILGNFLVILTLWKHKGMRTVTNVYLLNISLTDLLLTIFCLPFTVIGSIIKNFIFGAALCRILPFLQATSVSANMWTLVALSLERYFAIKHPLKSKKWQTTQRALKVNIMVWIFSGLVMSPLIYINRLVNINYYNLQEMIVSNDRNNTIFINNSPNSLDTLIKSQPQTVMDSKFEILVLYLLSNRSHFDGPYITKKVIKQPYSKRSTIACRELWFNTSRAIIFNWFINIFLFIIPLILMSIAYYNLAYCLTKVNRRDTTLIRNSPSPKVSQSFFTDLNVGLNIYRKKPKNLKIPSEGKGNDSVTINLNKSKDTLLSISHNSEPNQNRKLIESDKPVTPLLQSNIYDKVFFDENVFGILYPLYSHFKSDGDITSFNISYEGKMKPRSSPKKGKSRKRQQNTMHIHSLKSNSSVSSSNPSAHINSYGSNNNSGYIMDTKLLKIIRMLIVIVLEFFICWTPLYLINTWVTHDSLSFYFGAGYYLSRHAYIIHLLAYLSCCLNPITYCFMNRRRIRKKVKKNYLKH